MATPETGDLMGTPASIKDMVLPQTLPMDVLPLEASASDTSLNAYGNSDSSGITGNSARSILGEAVMNKLGAGRFKAWSAGSQPKGEVHPMALSVLSGMGYDTIGMYSKSWSKGYDEHGFTSESPLWAKMKS